MMIVAELDRNRYTMPNGSSSPLEPQTPARKIFHLPDSLTMSPKKGNLLDVASNNDLKHALDTKRLEFHQALKDVECAKSRAEMLVQEKFLIACQVQHLDKKSKRESLELYFLAEFSFEYIMNLSLFFFNLVLC